MDQEILEKIKELQNNRINALDDCICHIMLAIDELKDYKDSELSIHLLSDDLQGLLMSAKVISRDLKDEALGYEIY